MEIDRGAIPLVLFRLDGSLTQPTISAGCLWYPSSWVSLIRGPSADCVRVVHIGVGVH